MDRDSEGNWRIFSATDISTFTRNGKTFTQEEISIHYRLNYKPRYFNRDLSRSQFAHPLKGRSQCIWNSTRWVLLWERGNRINGLCSNSYTRERTKLLEPGRPRIWRSIQWYIAPNTLVERRFRTYLTLSHNLWFITSDCSKMLAEYITPLFVSIFLLRVNLIKQLEIDELIEDVVFDGISLKSKLKLHLKW